MPNESLYAHLHFSIKNKEYIQLKDKQEKRIMKEDLVRQFVEKLDYSYNYKTVNERQNIINELCQIAEIEPLDKLPMGALFLTENQKDQLGFAHYCLELDIIIPTSKDLLRYEKQGGWKYYEKHIANAERETE